MPGRAEGSFGWYRRMWPCPDDFRDRGPLFLCAVLCAVVDQTPVRNVLMAYRPGSRTQPPRCQAGCHILMAFPTHLPPPSFLPNPRLSHPLLPPPSPPPITNLPPSLPSSIFFPPFSSAFAFSTPFYSPHLSLPTNHLLHNYCLSLPFPPHSQKKNHKHHYHQQHPN